MRAWQAAPLAALLWSCHAALPPVPAAVGLPTAAPEALGFDTAGLRAAVSYLGAEAASGAFPGAVLAVGRHGRLAVLASVGQYSTEDRRPVLPQTIYDLASLTKVVVLTTACMMLADQGVLALDAPVQRYLPAFQGPGKDQVTIRELLTHSSGLPAWRPLYREAATPAAALALVDTTPLTTAPGAHFEYSDLGAIVLTQVVERLSGESLDEFARTRLFVPLGMTVTRYRPPPSWRPLVAATERDTAFRHRLLVGEVDDANAAWLGGVSGHAGLFSNALDLSRFAAMLLNGGAWDSVELVRSETLAEFTRRQDLPTGSTRALGWDTPDEPPDSTSSAGSEFSSHSFGHTGFTGTSLWLDPDRDLFLILLTNRVNPTPANTAIRRVRHQLANLVIDALTHPEL